MRERGEVWWPLRFPGRVLVMGEVALLPLRAAALGLEVVLMGGLLAAAGVGAAAYGKLIPEPVLRSAAESAGSAVLSVLRGQRVY